MNFKKLYFTLFLFLFTGLYAFAQNDTIGLRTIVSKTVKLANEHPFEKVYLHFDKPYYAIGDTIWFKAYLTIDVHQPSQLSKIVYVDLISSKDSTVQTLKLQVTGSTALGDFILSSPLYKQGNYHVRAYTNWMRNEDPAYFFNKTIPVGSINNQLTTNIALSGNTKNNVSKVTAKIVYKDATGKPYVNRKVNWKSFNDDVNIAKGKGVTNANGVLDITFTTNKTAELPSCVIETTIDITDDKSLTNSFALTHALDQPDVQFFPEGGDLIAGVRSKVAFKALQTNGLGLDIKGNVTDNTGAVVADFTSSHLGMGIFALLPEADKTYKANITFPDGSQTSVNLPEAKPEGISLAVYNTDPQNLIVKLSANPAFFQQYQNKLFYIVGQNGQTICFAAQTSLQSNVYSASIAKTKFPSGLIKFTLLTDHGVPLAERVTFNLRNDLLNLTMKTPQATYGTRQKVTVNVAALKDGKPAEANLSVTVLDESKVPYDENAETTILTNLLLTSDIKGYIEKPNSYFNNTDDKTKGDLDILMLTQGYRRFTYPDIMANKYAAPNKYLPEQGLTVSGTIRNATGLPIARGNLTLLAPERRLTKNTIANMVGEFKFTNLLLPDSTKITVNAKNNVNANNLLIILDNSSLQPVSTNIEAPAGVSNIDSTMSAYLQNSKQQFANSRVLKEVVIKSTSFVKKPSHQDFPELLGLSMEADQVIPGDRLGACPFLAQCLQSGTLGLTYDQNNLFVMRTYNQGDKRPVQIYYNGLAVDYDYLNGVSPADVESVEVFYNDGLSGINKMNNTNGVLVIIGKKVKKVQMSAAEIRAFFAPQYSAQNIILRGYSQSLAFYAPKYDPTRPATSFGGDLRSTIYWNPKIVTDKTGNATFDFYNSDGKGSYRAIIEGIDSDGNIGRYLYRYKVQ